MSSLAKPFLAAAIFALLAATLGAAPPFVPPNDAYPPFRRDKLPIDTDSMASLSREISLLSHAASLDAAPQRRAAAQALALALALDPANSDARDILSSIAGGKRLRSLRPDELTRAKTRVWQLSDWLATPEAGADANLLADLIGDTASTLDPSHPSAIVMRDSGERGKWEGWVAPLSDFEEPEPVRSENPPERPTDPPSEKLPPQIALTEATAKTVLFAYDEKEKVNRFGQTIARIEGRKGKEGQEQDQGFELRVPCREGYEEDVADFIAKPILRALETAGIPIPMDGRITLRAGDSDTYSFRRNTNAISGTGFLLAHAALTGSVPEATVIGVIDQKGGFASPTHLWYYVDALRAGDGGRLVIPTAAEEHFLALLSFEEPEFFLKYEVFTASNPKEFAELCARTPTPKQASVSVKFQEIRDKAPTSGLGPYFANRFVRQRLLDIHAEMPQHLSAKMLAIQGSPERPPRTLPKKILASVIWQAVAPIHTQLDIDLFELNDKRVASMEKTYEEAREALARLDRLTERADTELLSRAKSVVSDLRSLIRAFGSRSGDWDFRYAGIAKAYDSVKKSNDSLRAELTLITGDPPPEQAVEHIRRQRGR